MVKWPLPAAGAVPAGTTAFAVVFDAAAEGAGFLAGLPAWEEPWPGPQADVDPEEVVLVDGALPASAVRAAEPDGPAAVSVAGGWTGAGAGVAFAAVPGRPPGGREVDALPLSPSSG